MQDSFIDIGANLTDQSFDQDRDTVIKDSFKNGIEQRANIMYVIERSQLIVFIFMVHFF